MAFLTLCAGVAHAEPRFQRIRVLDPFMAQLVQDGLRASPSFRALVNRLTDSDVVVYLRREWDIPARHSGRLRLLSAAGGARYLVVSVQSQMGQKQQVAALGHELRHAVEIAETPSIVDQASLRAAYLRTGFVTGRLSYKETCETVAAIDEGRRILEEIGAFAHRRQRPHADAGSGAVMTGGPHDD